MALVDRQEERSRLQRVLDDARQGSSATLVIRGEPGIGKTALINHTADTATDFLVIRITGVETEQDIAFGALHRFLAPHLEQVPLLAAPQRHALRTALGLADGLAGDPFLVGLATISVVSNVVATSGRPLLCIIDDAQWVDSASLHAFTFWARRIESDGIALIFGERTRAEPNALDDFALLELSGLDDHAARELLTATSAGSLFDVATSDRIVADTRGNPLALVEFGRERDPNALTGATAAHQPLPMSAVLERRYARQLRSLPMDTQMLLLLIAADSSGDSALVWKAAASIGIEPVAAERAEAAGLVALGQRVDFRHPLIRSAVYGCVRPADRRAAHRALASVTDAERDTDRWVWHLAGGSIGHDERVATTLERCAVRAGHRGAHAAKMAMLSRAADLTPDRARAAGRLLAAAEAALHANLPAQTRALVERATPDLPSPSLRSVAQRLDGYALFRFSLPDEAAPMLLSAAHALLDHDPGLARRSLLEVLQAAFLLGSDASDVCKEAARRAAELAARVAPGDDPMVDALLLAFATWARAGFVEAAPLLRAAGMAMADESVPIEQVVGWTFLIAGTTISTWDHELLHAAYTRLVRASRERGELQWLTVALHIGSVSEIHAGRFDGAADLLAQAADIASAALIDRMGADMLSIVLAAHRGDDATIWSHAAEVIDVISTVATESGTFTIQCALAEHEIALGRYGDAVIRASAVFDADPPQFGNQILAGMVEAATRAGDQAAAERAMERLSARAIASGTPWAMGLLARCRALRAGDDAEALYNEAITIFSTTQLAIELARSHLVYGEWLRRQNRRVDARDHLRTAFDMFASIGSQAFANRAHAELLATGEHARRRTVETANDLTPREAHVARLAADGQTNAEIAAELFIGANTVDYHLRKVFRKLAVASRKELKRALPVGESAP